MLLVAGSLLKRDWLAAEHPLCGYFSPGRKVRCWADSARSEFPVLDFESVGSRLRDLPRHEREERAQSLAFPTLRRALLWVHLHLLTTMVLELVVEKQLLGFFRWRSERSASFLVTALLASL